MVFPVEEPHAASESRVTAKRNMATVFFMIYLPAYLLFDDIADSDNRLYSAILTILYLLANHCASIDVYAFSEYITSSLKTVSAFDNIKKQGRCNHYDAYASTMWIYISLRDM